METNNLSFFKNLSLSKKASKYRVTVTSDKWLTLSIHRGHNIRIQG